MTANRPAILIIDKALASLETRLKLYEVRRLWDYPDVPAFALAEGQDVRAIVTGGWSRVDSALIDAFPNLGLIACLASGYEGVDVEHARARGVEVTHTASVNHEDVADHAIGLLLAAVRGIVSGDRWVRQGRWGQAQWPSSRSLASLKVGIVGLGVIGKTIARRLQAFGPEIAWWGRNHQPDAGFPRLESLIDLARWSDVLIVAARSDGGNRGLIDKSVIEALGSEGLLINVARGAIVDEDALVTALKDKRLGCAALDVFVTEPTPPQRWTELDNVVLTPHIAGNTTTALPAMVALMMENLRAYFAGEAIPTPVPHG